MDKSRTHYSILNVSTNVIGYFINTIIGFVCRIIFVRCLSADYLGINGLFTNILTMLSLAELGIGNAIVFALYKPLATHDEEKISSLVHFYGKAYRIIGLVVAGIGLMIMPFLNVIIREQPAIKESLTLIYLIYLFNTASTYFFSYRSSLLMAAQQSYLVTGLNYIITISQSILQIIYLLLRHDYMGYLLISTAGTLIYNVLISRIAVRKFPYIVKKSQPLSKNETTSLMKNIRDLTIYKLSGLLVNSTDNIIITFFKGLSVSGITSNYTLFTTTLNGLLNQMFNGIYSSIGNHNALAEDCEKERMFYNINMVNFWLFGWATLGIIFVSSDLVNLCFGIDYVMTWDIPFVLGLNVYIVGMQNAIWTYKNTMGIFKQGRFMQLFTALFNILFSILLGKYYGVFGILIASAISRLITNVWYDPYCVFKYGFHSNPLNYLKKYILFLFIVCFTGVCCTLSCLFINCSIVPRILIKSVIITLIWNIILIVVFYNTKEFLFIKNTLKRILRKLSL